MEALALRRQFARRPSLGPNGGLLESESDAVENESIGQSFGESCDRRVVDDELPASGVDRGPHPFEERVKFIVRKAVNTPRGRGSLKPNIARESRLPTEDHALHCTESAHLAQAFGGLIPCVSGLGESTGS